MSGNLFDLREDWPIPPTNNIITATNSKLPIKIEPQEQEQPNPSATVPPKAEQCGWGPNCPICKNIEEDWDGKHQKQLQPNTRSTQMQDTQQKSFLSGTMAYKITPSIKVAIPACFRPKITRLLSQMSQCHTDAII